MKLLTPNPAEVVDRQTVLKLKAQNGTQAKIPVQRFIEECNALQDYLEKNWLVLAPKSIQDGYDRLYKEMEEVNQKMWTVRNDTRAFLATYNVSGGREAEANLLALLQQAIWTEDKRDQIKRQINLLFGLQPQQEKIYNNANTRTSTGSRL